MRQLNATELSKLELLTSRQLEVTLLEPTETGLSKSIMDATAVVRDFLERKKVHDFSTQPQGPENKRIIETNIITDSGLLPSTTSLYRPMTKKGDPRIWVSALKSHSSAGDIIAIAYFDAKLWVFNISKIDIHAALKKGGALSDLLTRNEVEQTEIAEELVAKIRKLAERGFIPSPYKGDTAIGHLLEDELGISINSSKEPDYKGIELKSARSERKNRKNLFAQVPEWDISVLKSSKQILDKYGYELDGKMRLYCTVKATAYNPQTLKLSIDQDQGVLREVSSRDGDVVSWRLATLEDRLLKKHKETFWVKAASKSIDGIEHFKFISIEHTRDPILSQLAILIDQGKITVDHLIKEKGNSAAEKGPIFKLDEKALALLFPPSVIYEL